MSFSLWWLKFCLIKESLLRNDSSDLEGERRERLSALRQTIVRLWSHWSIIYWSSHTMHHCEHWEKSSKESPNCYRSAKIDLLSAKAFGEGVRRRHSALHSETCSETQLASRTLLALCDPRKAGSLWLGVFVVSASLFVSAFPCLHFAQYYALDSAADGRPLLDNNALIFPVYLS